MDNVVLELSPEEKLNMVLLIFVNTPGRLRTHQSLYGLFKKGISDDAELVQIIKKLQKDELISYGGEFPIDDVQTSDCYVLTYDGELFISNGGYVYQSALERQKQDSTKRLERAARNNTLALSLGTGAIALGTIGLLIWEMVKFLCLEKH